MDDKIASIVFPDWIVQHGMIRVCLESLYVQRLFPINSILIVWLKLFRFCFTRLRYDNCLNNGIFPE